MKAIILAGGYAKRLWPLTKELAKPLVDIENRPIIDYIMDKLDSSGEISEIFVSTNAKFEENFLKWLESRTFSKPVKIIIERTASEDEKLGAIGGLQYAIEQQGIDDDLLVMGGDNLIGIDMNQMIKEFRTRCKEKNALVAAFDIKDKGQVKERYGEIIAGEDNKMIELREKPKDPVSSLVSTCCYIFPKGMGKEIEKYIKEGGNKDAPGFLISWHSRNHGVMVHIFDTYWFDIGDHASLERTREFVKNNKEKL